MLDGKIAKASTEVKTGQKIALLFGNRTITATVVGVPNATQKIMPIDTMIADVVITPVPRNTPQAQHPSDDD